MKKMNTRVLAFLMSLVMVVALLPANALAKGDLSSADTAVADIVDTDTPEVGAPEVDAPEGNLPEIDIPEGDIPLAGTPKADAAEMVTVTFRYRENGSADIVGEWKLHAEVEVEIGQSLGNQMPNVPSPNGWSLLGLQFVGWNTDSASNGLDFNADTPVTERITLYAQTVTAGGATEYHVMNNDKMLNQEIAAQYNKAVAVDKRTTADNVQIGDITVVSTSGKATNPNYTSNGWKQSGNWYFLCNVWFVKTAITLDTLWNNSVSPADIAAIKVNATVNGKNANYTIPVSQLNILRANDRVVEIYVTTLTEVEDPTPPVETSYTMFLEYHYDNNGNGAPVSASVLTETAKALAIDGVTYTVADGRINLTISKSALSENKQFDYSKFIFETLTDGATLTNKGQDNNIWTSFDKDGAAIKVPKLLYNKAAEMNAWYFIRTDGVIPTENGNGTTYPSTKYLPNHDDPNSPFLAGTVLKESSWTTSSGTITDGTLNGEALSTAFAGVQEALGVQPTDEAIKAAFARVGKTYDPATQGVVWYVVKVARHSNYGCPGYHVDGILYNKSSSTEPTYLIKYLSNIPDVDNELLATSYPYDKGAIAEVGDVLPTREGYDFLGWSTVRNDNINLLQKGSKITMDSDIPLYAQWKIKTYDVTYSWEGAPTSGVTPPAKTTVSHGGSHTVDTTFTAGAKISADDGTYTFSGWNKTGELTNITAHVALTGKWTFAKDEVPPTPVTYAVTYQYTGTVPAGVNPPVDGTKYEAGAQVTLAVAPAAPANYTFHGWTLSGGLTATDGRFTMPESGVTVTGNWTYTTPGGGGGDPTPNYTVTVNYLQQGTSTVLAPAYSTSMASGSRYDVSAQASRAITGYAIASTSGAVSGTLNNNVTINVYYTADTTIPDENPPLGPGPGDGGTTIPDENVPTAPGPDDGTSIPDENVPTAPGPDDNTVITDGEVPLGNLPQTGTAAPVDASLTLGLLALAASMAAAGLTFTLFRKKEEEI